MRQVIAFGGGILFDEDLIKYSIQQCPKYHQEDSIIHLLYLPTAGGDNQQHILEFYETFSCLKPKVQISHLSLTKFHHTEDFNQEVFISKQAARNELNHRKQMLKSHIHSTITNSDIIFVGGGYTLNMLTLWDLYGISDMLKKSYNNGTVMCGMSAGAICWFHGGVTDSYGALTDFELGLQLIPFRCCPHYSYSTRRYATKVLLFTEYDNNDDESADESPKNNNVIQVSSDTFCDQRGCIEKEKKFSSSSPSRLPLIGIDDGVAVHFVNENVKGRIATRKKNGAYYVTLSSSSSSSSKQPNEDLESKIDLIHTLIEPEILFPSK